ncbi:MAG TPA: glycosyl hydrolase family 79 C-terminal domain-containing protein [Alphaproteobacteria bacterium]|nr:glycosyl hydrolase family 79 C-terminal domain-containing protein [Alphaproteobacteria bacterium]
MKKFLSFFILFGLASWVRAQSPITVTIKNSPGYAIPEDFSGLSFESGHQMPNKNGVSGNLFSPTNTQLITLFRNMGLRNLRIGGGTVDGLGGGARLTHADIDNLFAFAEAANVKVIFSLQLLNGDIASDVATARYVWQNHRSQLEWLAIGNEPDEPPYLYPPFGKGTDPTITNYATWLPHWRTFAAAVTNGLPGVTFAAPDTGGSKWNTNFPDDEAGSGMVSLFTTHDYFGGHWESQTADTAVSNMLSPRWVNKLYPKELRAQSHVIRDGYPFRLTELNDYLGGVKNASDAFAAALWSLDVMHWWAVHEAAGVNFHNNEWLLTDTVYLNKGNHSFQIRPKGYGIKAFDLGGHGRVEPLSMTNTNNVNLTAYAVADPTNLYVTLINKEYGSNGSEAAVGIDLNGFGSGDVSAMYLTVAGGYVKATRGVTLGGEYITNNTDWQGHWTALGRVTNGEFRLTVPEASAAVVRMKVVPR